MKEKYDLKDLFNFMDKQFKKIKESDQKYKINNMLIDNDINLIE